MSWADKFKKMVEQPQPQPEPVPEPEPVEQPKPKNRKRKINIAFRVTEEEAAMLNEKVAVSGMSKTDFFIEAIKDSSIVILNDGMDLIKELRKQGSNLNQAVKLAHRSGSTNLPELEEALQEHQKTQQELLDFLKRWDIRFEKKE